MKLKMTSIVLLLFLFTVFIETDASDAGEQRNWQQLRQLILEAQQRNNALLDQATASGVPASGDQLDSNGIPVEIYLRGLSKDELIVHAREWIRNITDDSEDAQSWQFEYYEEHPNSSKDIPNNCNDDYISTHNFPIFFKENSQETPEKIEDELEKK